MSTPLRERPDAPLGTLIFRAGLLPAETIESALEEGVKTGKRLGEILTERGLLKEADLARLLAGQKGLDFVTLREQIVDFSAAALFNEDQARLFRALPYAWEEGAPVIAIADPSDEVLTRNVREALGRDDAKFVVSVRSELSDIIGETYARSAAAAPAPAEVEAPAAPDTFEDQTAEPAPAYPAPTLPVEPPAPERTVEPSVPEPVAAAAAAPPTPEDVPVGPAPEPAAADVSEETPMEHAVNGHSGNGVVAAEVVLVPQPEPQVEPVVAVEPAPVPTVEPQPPAPPAPEQPVVAPELRVPAPEPVVVEPVAAEPVVVEPVTVEPVVVEPVSEPAAVEPALEPAVHAPVVEQPAPAPAPAPEPVAVEVEAAATHVEPETPAAPAPEPAAEEPAPQALEPEPETQPAPEEDISFAVSIRLTNGERVEVGAYGDVEAAKASAKALMAQVAAADGGDWPFVSGRFLKPDTIVSVDIA